MGHRLAGLIVQMLDIVDAELLVFVQHRHHADGDVPVLPDPHQLVHLLTHAHGSILPPVAHIQLAVEAGLKQGTDDRFGLAALRCTFVEFKGFQSAII